MADIAIDEWTVTALALPGVDRESVATRLAEIAGVRGPTRREAQEYLVEVLLSALSRIPRVPTAWSWGEVYNAGIQPMSDIGRDEDWMRLAICAVDLGVDDQAPTLYAGEEALTPRGGLARNLTEATDRLIAGVREILQEAGIDTHGHKGFPPPS